MFARKEYMTGLEFGNILPPKYQLPDGCTITGCGDVTEIDKHPETEGALLG
jgi:hypothetical protein